jgi:hypothetical protein
MDSGLIIHLEGRKLGLATHTYGDGEATLSPGHPATLPTAVTCGLSCSSLSRTVRITCNIEMILYSVLKCHSEGVNDR